MTSRFALLIAILVNAETMTSSADSDVTNIRLRKILDTTYNKHKAPSAMEGGPTVVQLSLHIRELLLSEHDMTMSVYGVDVMQSWTDSRLAAVTHDVADHRLYGDDVNVVWTPSLHVVNARRRDAAADHRVLAVSTAGLVILHQRLSVDVLCANFTSHMKPLVCSVQLQPYSHTDTEVVYEWGPVTVEPYLTIPKYSLIRLETSSCVLQTSIGSYSCKQLSASFRADVNFFATEVYGATFLLVALSWTGFWVDPRRYGGGGAAIRLGLGLIIVLILVVYGVGFRLLHNKVGVPGNVEVWVAFCTLFVLASLIEYVFVHVLLCTVPGQIKHVCCKWTANRPDRRTSSCHLSATDVNAVSMSRNEGVNSYQKAARVIDVTCGLLFPFIFVLFNVAYWLTY